MPQAVASESISNILKPSETVLKKLPPTNTNDLISTMIDYESAAAANGIDFSAGNFLSTDTAQRDYYRAELIGDYIRLSAGNIGKTPVFFDTQLNAFCKKICSMAVPSHELLGTYLAALKVINQNKKYKSVQGLPESAQKTIIAVLQGCVTILADKIEA